MNALRLGGIAVAYNGRTVVHGVSIDVAPGSWLAIVGPNGAGKSTLLKAIAGLVPYSGSIALHGSPTTTMTRKQRANLLGYAAQNPVLPDKLTVTDYVLLGRTPYLTPLGRESAADHDLVGDTLQRLGLTELAGRKLDTLSGGERQRAVLARVLAQRTRLLLLDEPTSGLDIGHAQVLLERLDRLRTEDGTTVVTTLHDLTFAAQYADTLLLLDRGEVVVSGVGAEVLTSEHLHRHYGARVEVLTTSGGAPVVAPVREP